MGFLETVTPKEVEAGQILSLVTMVVLLGVGFIPPLRPYAHRIRVAMATVYIGGVLAFVAYCAVSR